LANNSVSQAIIGALAAHLKANVPALAAVYDDFPGPSQKLKYPCASIFTGQPKFEPLMPYVIAKGTSADADNRYLVRRCVGHYIFNLQLDVWCESKFDRHKMHELIFAGFNSDQKVMGLSKQLGDYFNEYARFSMTGFNFTDSEEASQRSEWRVKFDIVADCKAILETYEHLIETIENNLETPTSALIPDEEDVGSII
jgi:hypothetical protein